MHSSLRTKILTKTERKKGEEEGRRRGEEEDKGRELAELLPIVLPTFRFENTASTRHHPLN